MFKKGSRDNCGGVGVCEREDSLDALIEVRGISDDTEEIVIFPDTAEQVAQILNSPVDGASLVDQIEIFDELKFVEYKKLDKTQCEVGDRIIINLSNGDKQLSEIVDIAVLKFQEGSDPINGNNLHEIQERILEGVRAGESNRFRIMAGLSEELFKVGNLFRYDVQNGEALPVYITGIQVEKNQNPRASKGVRVADDYRFNENASLEVQKIELISNLPQNKAVNRFAEGHNARIMEGVPMDYVCESSLIEGDLVEIRLDNGATRYEQVLGVESNPDRILLKNLEIAQTSMYSFERGISYRFQRGAVPTQIIGFGESGSIRIRSLVVYRNVRVVNEKNEKL